MSHFERLIFVMQIDSYFHLTHLFVTNKLLPSILLFCQLFQSAVHWEVIAHMCRQ